MKINKVILIGFYIILLLVSIGLVAYLLVKKEKYYLKQYSSESEISNKKWELNEQLGLIRYINSEDYVLQLGGNIGASCITVYKQCNPKRNVCVEPNNKLIPILTENINKHSKGIEIINGIITNSDKPNYLEYGEGPNLWGGNTLKKNKKAQLVKNIRLEDLEKEHQPFNVLFADCEGCLPIFLKEYHDHHWDLIIYEPDADVNYDIVEKIAKLNNLILCPTYPGLIIWAKPDRCKNKHVDTW
jgi:FkbM family methyltransferase